MFRSKQLYRLLPSQVKAIRTNASSLATKSSTLPRDAVQNEGSLIPEYMRHKDKESFLNKWQRIMDGDSGPMIPMGIILVGAHIFVLWYLFGGEFEDDFGEDINHEDVRAFSSTVLKIKRAFINLTTSLGLRNPKSIQQRSNETEQDS